MLCVLNQKPTLKAVVIQQSVGGSNLFHFQRLFNNLCYKIGYFDFRIVVKFYKFSVQYVVF